MSRVCALVSLTEFDEEGLEFGFTEKEFMPEFESGGTAQFYQLWQKGDEELIKSPSLGDQNLSQLGTELGQHQISNLQLPDGRSGRMIEFVFMPRIDVDDIEEEDYVDPSTYPPSYPITMIFARERDSLDQSLFAIGFTIFGVILIVLAFSGLVIRRLVGRGLQPLSRLATQVRNIDESSLQVRVAHDGEQSSEIAPIEDQLNNLLERLESAFEREKRFSSNVAHELRTPLSELKTLAEVGKMVPDDVDEVKAFFTDVGEVSTQMEKIVTTLLELARSDAGLLLIEPEDIDLAAYCDDVWRQAINGLGRGRQLVTTIPAGLMVNTDRAKLGLILTNLLTNAVSYSPDHAEIQINAEIRNNNIVLSVRNASINLKPEDILHMRDRFWRKQKEGGEFGHSGLGLSLVDALAKIMKLDVNMNLDQKNVFMVTISGLSPSITLIEPLNNSS